MSLDVARSKQRTEYLATNSPEVDFALVLSRVIESVKENPAELRNAVYELARVKLHREGWQTKTDLWEMRRLSMALETAIERVEALSSKQQEVRALQSLERLIGSFDAQSLSPSAHSVVLIDQIPRAQEEAKQSGRWRPGPAIFWIKNITWKAQQWVPVALRRRAAPAARIVLILVVAVASYAAFSKFGMFTGTVPSADNGPQIAVSSLPESHPELPVEIVQPPRPVAVAASPTAIPPAEQERSRGFPLPTVYGIYAIGQGKLYELDALPGRAPDPRIFMSAIITKVSKTIVADGRVSFIAYRRDLATSAPDRVVVRVIAKVKRSLAIDPTGKARVSAVEDAWAIRNSSYEFRVSPIPGSPEMILLHPEELNFVFPAGRYAMVLNGLSYDFTVLGEVVESVQCLERTIAANGTFYSECRKP